MSETADLLLMLKGRDDADSEAVLQMAPRWLVDAFAPERTVEEDEAWLVQWQAAPDRWPSSGNLAGLLPAGFTGSLRATSFGASVTPVSMRAGIVSWFYLEHDDDPIPFEALRWLALLAELQVGNEVRLD
ncbi:hypothetical protein V6U90_13430 [Micromonospora sp. CPCC 206060]|uniref:hypothetical protein n=1 Tax=Micromonospora sp. CPCC 206060 TaxID=3122406 RepID=UPI002FEECF9C